MINQEKETKHKYRIRSCMNCENQRCNTRERELQDEYVWSDKAKYGCLDYKSSNREIMNEIPKVIND